jgi:AAA+ ATPase superfamily predicted ATPase
MYNTKHIIQSVLYILYICGMNYIPNPFLLSGYIDPASFCDREEETKRLVTHVLNGVNTCLISVRRMGKTGLIYHTFHTLQQKKKIPGIYLDLYATQNLKDLNSLLATSVLKAFPEHQGVGKKFMTLLKSLRPVVSYDPLSGDPEVRLDLSSPKQQDASLTSLFTFLEKQNTPLLVAFDEFQQIDSYPEKNTEALLRSLIQPLKNVRFIFSGSSRHLLTDMFANHKRPFFSSTAMLSLGPIAQAKYAAFIADKFQIHKRKISPEAIQFITDWSRLHTYYTQAVCNHIFATGIRNITLPVVQHECARLLKEQEPVFYQYRNLLTRIQWDLLMAIAKEDKVYQPSSKNFLASHPVGTASNVQRALEALLSKEMVFSERDDKGNYYRVYDCFLARWLEQF